MQTGEKVAIKIIKKSSLASEADHQRVARELKILKTAQHAAVAQLFEIIESKTKLYIVMEYCPEGELFTLIVNSKKLTE